ncbi:Transposase, MuDR, plant [Corchorus capsularis]|uniref:Transposase, MuDR, plant n=1 Tax=Corchorus capsularis TaxID=210143 RepID=A0A1R3J3T6_COCAP|nr:Transposase, MuDR, plant [Corchorus capsularis]
MYKNLFNIEDGVAVDAEEVAEDNSEKEDVDWDENLKAYLVRTKAFTEEDHDPEGCLAREKIYESVRRGSRHKALVSREEEGEDDVDADPLEEIFRNIRERELTTTNDEVVEVQRGYESDNYLSDEARSLVNSDGDLDHDDATSRRSRYPRFNFNAAIPEFAKTMVFIDHEQFRYAIKKYSLASKKELRFVKNEPRRLRVKCKVTDSCPWRIYAAWNEEIRAVQNQFKPLKSNGASSGSSHGAGLFKPTAKSSVTHGTKRNSLLQTQLAPKNRLRSKDECAWPHLL